MFENREKQRVPAVTFKTRRNDEWLTISSDDIFAEKTVVVFSLPGAFTPTCSSSHVPRYDQLAIDGVAPVTRAGAGRSLARQL